MEKIVKEIGEEILKTKLPTELTDEYVKVSLRRVKIFKNDFV